ncbi:unnamed protein product, partial [Symbiodinium sp. CCMP2592]
MPPRRRLVGRGRGCAGGHGRRGGAGAVPRARRARAAAPDPQIAAALLALGAPRNAPCNADGPSKRAGAEQRESLITSALRPCDLFNSESDQVASGEMTMTLANAIRDIKGSSELVPAAVIAMMYGRIMVHFAASAEIGAQAWGSTTLQTIALAGAMVVAAGGSSLDEDDLALDDPDLNDIYTTELAAHSADLQRIMGAVTGNAAPADLDLYPRAISLCVAMFLELGTKSQATTRRPGSEAQLTKLLADSIGMAEAASATNSDKKALNAIFSACHTLRFRIIMIGSILSPAVTDTDLLTAQNALKDWVDESTDRLEKEHTRWEPGKQYRLFDLTCLNEQLAARFDGAHLLLGIDQKHAAALRTLRVIAAHLAVGFSAGLTPLLEELKVVVSEFDKGIKSTGTYTAFPVYTPNSDGTLSEVTREGLAFRQRHPGLNSYAISLNAATKLDKAVLRDLGRQSACENLTLCVALFQHELYCQSCVHGNATLTSSVSGCQTTLSRLRDSLLLCSETRVKQPSLGLRHPDDPSSTNLLPDWMLRSIGDTFLDHGPQDRLVLMMAVSRLVQVLLANLGTALENAMRDQSEGPKDEVEVEVDDSSYMQLPNTGDWSKLLRSLQEDMESRDKLVMSRAAEWLMDWLNHRCTDSQAGKFLGHMDGAVSDIVALLVIPLDSSSAEESQAGEAVSALVPASPMEDTGVAPTQMIHTPEEPSPGKKRRTCVVEMASGSGQAPQVVTFPMEGGSSELHIGMTVRVEESQPLAPASDSEDDVRTQLLEMEDGPGDEVSTDVLLNIYPIWASGMISDDKVISAYGLEGFPISE